MLTGIPRLLLLPDPNLCRCLTQQEPVSEEQERSEQIVSFFFFFFIRLGNIIYCIKINLLQ